MGEVRVDSDDDDDGGVTLPPPPPPPPPKDLLRLIMESVRDWLLGRAFCSGAIWLAELSVRLDLSMDFGTIALSFSVVGDADGSGGIASASASEVVEMTRAVCERRRRKELGGNTWTGYGDSWLKTIVLIDGLLRDCCS